MNEDDTFSALRKLTFHEVKNKIQEYDEKGPRHIISTRGAVEIIIAAGWSQNEYIEAHNKWWDSTHT